MRPIFFVYEPHTHPKLPHTKALIDALVAPVMAHLPEAVKVDHPHPDAINVRFWYTPTFDDDVFFGHGIADKNGRNADHLAGFGTIFHSGPRWQRKYLEQGLSADQIRQVGYTKLDPLFGMTQTTHTVLWAPTFAAHWQHSYEALRALILELPVERSVHCLDQPNHVTLTELVDADVVIADGGSTIYEAWALGKPVVFPDWAVGDLISPGSIEDEIYRLQIGYHAHHPDELPEVIEQAQQQGITAPERAFIDDIFPPELRGTSGKAHAEALMEIASR